MKTITKIIGCIGLSVALWHTPHGQAFTLKQINAYLEACRTESVQNLEALLKQEEERSDSGIKAANTEYILEFLTNYSNKKNVFYDGKGDFVIETVNLHNTSFEWFPFRAYEKQKRDDWRKKQKINPLDAISEELSANTLKQRGTNIEEMKQSDIKNVREITFASILKSPFFSEEQRKKGEKWFDDLNALKIAVKNYAKSCVPLYEKTEEFKISRRNTEIYTNNKGCIQTLTEADSDVYISDALWLPVSVDKAVTVKQKIQFCLERTLGFKNGKEKIILFLLLDEATPSEMRCKWVWHNQSKESSAYNAHDNAFLCNCNDIAWSLSHEIGHYLQKHLGLKQTFNDYQNPFAQELLLLKNNLPNDAMFAIPTPIQKKVSEFDGASYPQMLSAKACFEYCQLIARWDHPDEISNILGVYFKSDTLYLNALSDIRELQCIRYGHNSKISPEAIKKCCDLLKDENTKQTFTSICNEAFEKSATTEALGLLCRLHGRASEDAKNVVCDFDYDEQECAEKLVPALMEFIEAEQP